jgi:hypothetical protein
LDNASPVDTQKLVTVTNQKAIFISYCDYKPWQTTMREKVYFFNKKYYFKLHLQPPAPINKQQQQQLKQTNKK